MSITIYKGTNPFDANCDLEKILEIDEILYKQLFSHPIIIGQFPYIYEEFFTQVYEDGDNISFTFSELASFETQLKKIRQRLLKTFQKDADTLDLIISCIQTTYTEKLNLYICNFID